MNQTIGIDGLWWDPKSGMIGDTGAIISAGIGLYHELCHMIYKLGAEHENRLVKEFEKPFAISMEDGFRERHGGESFFHTFGVWSRTIDINYNPQKIPLLYDKKY